MATQDRTAQARGNSRTSMLVAAAAAAAAMAWTVHVLARRAERANPPVGKFIDVNGVRLHYVERGGGRPLVLLHGDGVMLQDFEVSGLLDRTEADYRVLAFDRPGYGYSTRPRGGQAWDPGAQARLLRDALARLGVENPLVLGHSWGTLVAIALALQQPDYPRALVLLSGYYYPTLRLDVALLSPPALPIVGDVMRHTISPLLGRLTWPLFLHRLFGPAPVPPRFADFPRDMVLRPSQLRAAAAEAALLIPAATALRGRYGDIRAPVVLVAGDQDRYVDTRTQSVRLHGELPESELLIASGVGHMVHHNAPETVMMALQAAERRASERAVPDVDRLTAPSPGARAGSPGIDRTAGGR